MSHAKSAIIDFCTRYPIWHSRVTLHQVVCMPDAVVSAIDELILNNKLEYNSTIDAVRIKIPNIGNKL